MYSTCVFPFRRASNQRPARGLAALALFFFISAGLGAEEPGAISGSVVTSDGEPVSDAVVTVVATRARAQADADGRFTLDQVPAGVQLLEVTSIRHARVVERVTVAAGETIEIDILVASRVHAEQIVVSAAPGRLGELDLASPVNILEGRELALRLEPTIGETLAQEAGVSSTYFAPGASRPIIRGLGGDRVKMLENGLDTLDASAASPDHAVAADPLVAERVEVVRGPATLLYGSNAIGGVVNVLDGRIPDFPAAEPFTGTLDLRVGSVADERTGAVNLDGGGGRWAWHLDLLARETDDYEIPGCASIDCGGEEDEHGEDEHEEEVVSGILPNSDIETTSGGVGASYFFGDSGFLGVSVRGFDSEYGVPGGEHGEHGEEDEHDEEGEHDEEDEHGEEGIRIDMRQRRYDLEGGITQPFGAFQGAKFRFGLVDYEHDELEAPGVIGTTFFNDAWEGRAEFIQKARGSHTGSFGLQLRRRDLEAIGEEAFIRPTESDNIGLFTFQELERGPVSYQFGLRYETQDTTVRDPELPDRDFDGLSASFGIVWRASEDYSLGASLARSVKMPTGEELYSEGLHFATSAFEIGIPDLTEESSLGLDVTLRKVEGRVTGAFNLFYNDFSDFIFQEFTGEEVEGFPVLQWSQSDADFWGAELDLSVLLAQSAHSSWDLDLLWDMVRAEFDDGGNLPRIPPQRFGIGVHYRGDKLRGGVEARFVDEQDRIAENETPTDSYTMVNGDVSYRFFFNSYFLDVILRGTNLTDEEARVHTSFVKDDVPLPGRNLTLIARFGF